MNIALRVFVVYILLNFKGYTGIVLVTVPFCPSALGPPKRRSRDGVTPATEIETTAATI